MPSPFNVKGEVILRNALTFKVKPEGISENPFVIYINLALRKYQCITLLLTRLAKTSTKWGGGALSPTPLNNKLNARVYLFYIGIDERKN